MSESIVWYAINSTNFSTICMTRDELDEIVKVYPSAAVETFSTFEEACEWLENIQIAGPSSRRESSGCIRSEKANKREGTPYGRQAPPSSHKTGPDSGSSTSPKPVKPRASEDFIYLSDDDSASSSEVDLKSNAPGPSRQGSKNDSSFSKDKGNLKGKAAVEVVMLSEEQKRVLEMVLAGNSVFFTGAAGTGKSVLLREIIKELRTKGASTAVTASTGIAAINIGGKTLHSFAGVGLGNQHIEHLIKKAMNNRTKKRWRKTQVLIIDEISMVDARWFDALSEIGKAVRGYDRPFGGLQLVVCGDFFQLPPVPEQSYVDAGIPVSFAFEARCWDTAVPNTITLTQVFRQKQSELVDMLNDMRLGLVSEGSSELFSGLSRTVEYTDGILPTEIFPLRRLADAANNGQMRRLTGEQIAFTATDSFGKDMYGQLIPPQRGKALLDRMVADEIKLKVGAQVMCTKNLPDSGIVNGSIGIIERFSTHQEGRAAPEVSIAIPNSDPKRKPGDAAPAPRPGQWEKERWPVVRYQNGRIVMMTPFEFTHENADGGVEARRTQVPLILAWALTVHKAQGQTLERVKVDLEGTFERGQAYVALSRCTTLEGLEVLNFSPAVVFAHPKVMDWAKTLAVIPTCEATP